MERNEHSQQQAYFMMTRPAHFAFSCVRKRRHKLYLSQAYASFVDTAPILGMVGYLKQSSCFYKYHSYYIFMTESNIAVCRFLTRIQHRCQTCIICTCLFLVETEISRVGYIHSVCYHCLPNFLPKECVSHTVQTLKAPGPAQVCRPLLDWSKLLKTFCPFLIEIEVQKLKEFLGHYMT